MIRAINSFRGRQTNNCAHLIANNALKTCGFIHKSNYFVCLKYSKNLDLVRRNEVPTQKTSTHGSRNVDKLITSFNL